jgi:hypothetical protein
VCRKRQILFEDLAAVGIFDREVNAFLIKQLVTCAPPLAQNAFEKDFLRRAINRPVGVDVTRQV